MSTDQFKFKSPMIAQRAKLLHQTLIDIMADMYQFAVDHNLPFEVTETVTTLEEDTRLQRVSATHRERRAFDLSTHGWDVPTCTEFVNHFNFKYADIAAIGAESKKPQLVVYGPPRHLDHFHVQIHHRFAVVFNA